MIRRGEDVGTLCPVHAVAVAALLATMAACGAPRTVAMPDPVPGPERVLVGDFETPPTETGVPLRWMLLYLDDADRPTEYGVLTEDGNSFLRARADESASGLVTKAPVDLRACPTLKWRWRVHATVPEGDITKKGRADAAARVLVAFPYDPREVGAITRLKYDLAKTDTGRYPPGRVLSYVWANGAKPGASLKSPYRKNVRIIVGRSGDDLAGQWVSEERNVYVDYVRAFGEPPSEVSGVGVITDTEDTGAKARADYDDIRFERLPAQAAGG